MQVFALNTKETDPFNDILPELSQISFPVLDDFEHSNLFFQDLGWVSVFPLNVVVDAQGVIRFAYRGHDLAGMKLAIEEALQDLGSAEPFGQCSEED